jgi:probable phosphoglycerate mutase
VPASVIYLLRHGETVWNVERRIQGSQDSALTPRGRDQARRMGDLLARAIPDLPDYSLQVSPLGRARETALLVAGQISLRPVVDERIAEVSLGCWDGLTRGEVEARFPGALAGASRHDWYFRSPDGESFEAALARARAWLATSAGQVIAVSHGLIGRLIRGCYVGLPAEAMLRLPTSQGGVYRLCGGAAELLT